VKGPLRRLRSALPDATRPIMVGGLGDL